MLVRTVYSACVMLILTQLQLQAQANDSVFTLTCIVYDQSFFPVPSSHVINLNSHQGEVTDSLGIFHMPVKINDTLLIRNMVYRDTLVMVSSFFEGKYIVLKRKYYALQEARIFEWGSSYLDFRSAIIEMPNRQTLGGSMGLPRKDPDYIPYDMNEEILKSAGFLLTSPVSYFYHNFSKHARSARKVYWLKKNKDKQHAFDEIVGIDNISSITGLEGEDVLSFLVFLYERMGCDFTCDELQIYTEIHGLWDVYQKINDI